MTHVTLIRQTPETAMALEDQVGSAIPEALANAVALTYALDHREEMSLDFLHGVFSGAVYILQATKKVSGERRIEAMSQLAVLFGQHWLEQLDMVAETKAKNGFDA